jgi:uncharacterized protein (TIGR00299 family) protein
LLAYLDCFSGIAGDMFLAALIDAGLPAETLKADLEKLPIGGWRLEVEDVVRCGVGCTLVKVELSEDHQPHRRLSDLLAILEGTDLDEAVLETAGRVFTNLAEAEAKVHRCPVEEVHFHEVGAVDAVVDVVGAVAGLHRLGVEEVVASPVNTGRGMVSTSHGTYPIPGPATLALLEGFPCYAEGPEIELATPTGAALLATLASSAGPMPPMVPRAVGYGAGRAEVEGRPNALRLVLGHRDPLAAGETVVVLETHLDDCSPELFDHVMSRCFAAGALDVSLSPIQMKKTRPGVALTAITPPEAAEAVTDVFFTETTTFGIRRTTTRRVVLDRELLMVQTDWGPVAVKVGRRSGRLVQVAPEFEDCRRIAEAKGIPLRAVQLASETAAMELLGDGGEGAEP